MQRTETAHRGMKMGLYRERAFAKGRPYDEIGRGIFSEGSP